jgi:DNA-binding NarL/FixJ family response regulator
VRDLGADDCALATGPGVLASPASRPPGGVTAREAAVIRALQQGKPNKVIAYELNMCESTVKVHVRNLMKKMKAKNRTDLAMKAQIALISQGLDGGLGRPVILHRMGTPQD